MSRKFNRLVGWSACALLTGALAFAAAGCGSSGGSSASKGASTEVKGLGSTLSEIKSKARTEGQVDLVVNDPEGGRVQAKVADGFPHGLPAQVHEGLRHQEPDPTGSFGPGARAHARLPALAVELHRQPPGQLFETGPAHVMARARVVRPGVAQAHDEQVGSVWIHLRRHEKARGECRRPRSEHGSQRPSGGWPVPR